MGKSKKIAELVVLFLAEDPAFDLARQSFTIVKVSAMLSILAANNQFGVV